MNQCRSASALFEADSNTRSRAIEGDWIEVTK